MRGGYRLWQVRTVLRNRFAPGAVVLAYHRVEESVSSGFGLAVSAAHFEEQLEVIRRLGRPTCLRDMVAELSRGRSTRGMVTLTFDDGYADNLLVAKPCLEAYDVPATVFVSSGFLGGEREFWWDRLERVAARTGEDPIGLRARLRVLSSTALEGEVARLESAARIQPASPAAHRCLTADETLRLVEGGLVEVGSHTVSHPALSMLTGAEQMEEFAESKRTLEGLLGRPVVSLSYPFGGSADLTPETASLAAQCGYESACVTWHGTVCRGTDVMRLPRFVVRDWDGDAFAGRLSEWLRGRHVLADT